MKPSFIAGMILFLPISSLIRVNIIMLASIAIPSGQNNTAIPSRVRVSWNALIRKIINTEKKPSARLPINPFSLYRTIIKATMIMNPIYPANKLVLIASCPSLAPTTLERISLN